MVFLKKKKPIKKEVEEIEDDDFPELEEDTPVEDSEAIDESDIMEEKRPMPKQQTASAPKTELEKNIDAFNKNFSGMPIEDLKAKILIAIYHELRELNRRIKD